MKARLPRVGGARRRAPRLATTTLALTAIAASSGCLDRPVAPLTPLTTSTETDLLKQTSVDKIDLLLMIDNSASMEDKQKVLAAAVPDLVTGILNPTCVDSTSGAPVANQPSGPLAACPKGSKRDFPPVLDIHVGIITSSMGSFGATGCAETAQGSCADLDDHAHLVTRSAPCDPSQTPVPTYQGEGFLAWDPNGTDKPAAGVGDIGTFTTQLTDLVTGTGQDGCGFEQQNEAWYRFLIDPAPAQSFTFPNLNVQKSGMDTDLTTQRGEFLRPDSLLAIIVLTDETDVSIKENTYFPVLAETGSYDSTGVYHSYQLPKPSAECATNPADKCCYTCGAIKVPDGCPDESGPGQACHADPNTGVTNLADNSAIRAFGLTNGAQSLKARYGIDFLYPMSRYVQALTQRTLTDDSGNSFPNPLLAQRDPSLLFYATITGVPWKLIAHRTNGQPDLSQGFMTPKELAGKDPTGQNTYWDDIVGDPDNYIPPKSPFMQESDVPRSGTDPITGITLSQSGDNGINGHEWTIPSAFPMVPGDSRGDIEYACTFTLPPAMQKNCKASLNTQGCNCADDAASLTNPLCAPNPDDSGKPTLQVGAKAYPGVRNLAIVKGMYDSGVDTGIVASICPKQFTNPEMMGPNQTMVPAPDYGYRPAVKAIIDRLKVAIHNQCLSRQLPTTNGSAPCLVLEQQPPGGDCSCSGTARAKVADQYKQAVVEAQQLEQQLDPGSPAGCFCEITQLEGNALHECQYDTSTSGIDGWCYVDATTDPPLGDTQLVSQCPASEKRQVRFVGKGTPAPNALTFVTCEGQ